MALSILPSNPKHRTAFWAAFGALAMLGLGFAAVPLYRLFCQVTGFGGTTQKADLAEAARVQVGTTKISVRFDSNTDPGLPWKFSPMQVTQEMAIGSRMMAFYRAENVSDKPVTGVASFNVQPELAGLYFKKVHCFCFNQQTLQPGESVEMPVQYYVDPAILKDPEAARIKQITLSYTFHTSADQSQAVKVAAKTLDPVPAAR
ncbi:MAG: cytochrome c oxidase assembly protein [Sphingomonadaceae bacterium]|nr:cytochrome c oxidase assembly protein [Sphingomonadaceae bacterium]